MTLSRAILAALALLAVAAPSAGAATHRVAVGAGGDERITAPRATVTQGDTVVFAWEDGGHDLVLAGPESTRVSEQDEGFRLTRTQMRPGEYSFLCTLHDDMSAELTIAADPAAPAPDGPPATDVVVGPDGDDGVDPADVTVVQGQTVNWHWGEDGIGVTFADGPSSGSRSMGAFWGRTFAATGTYPYRTSDGADGSVTVLAPGADAGSGIRPAPPGAYPAAVVSVGSGGNSFAPGTVTVDEGATVRWTWAGGPHNVRFEDGTDSGFRTSGSDDKAFYSPGTFSFLCSAHNGMTGTVEVTDTGAPGPNQPPPAPGPDPDPPPEEPPPPADPDPPGTPPAVEIGVGGAADAFSLPDVTVQTGQSVVWSWAGGVHNVHFADGVGSGVRSTGTWSRRFLTAGEYAYVCQLHAGMQGRVVAVGAPVAGPQPDPAGPAPPPAAALPANPPAPAAASPADRAAAHAPATAQKDAVRPALRRVGATLRRGRRSHTLRLTLTEDARLDVTMRAVGSSRDLVTTRRFKLYARQGARTLRLPKMNLTARSYRLRIVAVDRAGNRSAARTVVISLRR